MSRARSRVEKLAEQLAQLAQIPPERWYRRCTSLNFSAPDVSLTGGLSIALGVGPLVHHGDSNSVVFVTRVTYKGDDLVSTDEGGMFVALGKNHTRFANAAGSELVFFELYRLNPDGSKVSMNLPSEKWRRGTGILGIFWPKRPLQKLFEQLETSVGGRQ